MKDLIEQLGPALEGRAPVPDYMKLYARFCRVHRQTALTVFRETRKALGAEWQDVVEAYFQAHPMHHVEINANGAHFPDFLKERSALLAELADFEWWEWQTRITAGSDQGALGDTVEIRPYHWDFTDPSRPARDTLIVFWRDRLDRVRRETLSMAELSVIKAAHEGHAIEGPEHADLQAAGILK